MARRAIGGDKGVATGGGVIVGIDLTETSTAGMKFVDERVRTLRGDVHDVTPARLRSRSPSWATFTTVLSDMVRRCRFTAG